MAEVSNDLASGDLNSIIEYDFRKYDPINRLGINLTILRDSLRKVLKSIDNVAILHNRGEIEDLIDSSVHRGVYKEVSENVNSMLLSYSKMTKEIIQTLNKYAEGDFNFEVPQFPGDKNRINKSLVLLANNVIGINSEINNLVQSATEGNLKIEIEESKGKGEFKAVFIALNELISAISGPINESIGVLENISDGLFSKKVNGNYKGDFKLIKDALNTTVDRVYGYITEISQSLNKIANNNFNIEINREYTGEFFQIRDSINNITNNLSKVVNNIIDSSSLVGSGANNIQESSDGVAVGATKQEESINNLKDIMANLNDQAIQNSKNSRNAKSLAEELNSNAQNGSEQMSQMITSMSEILSSSDDILSITNVYRRYFVSN